MHEVCSNEHDSHGYQNLYKKGDNFEVLTMHEHCKW